MANGFLRGGMRPSSGGPNRGRESFLKKSSSSMPMPPHRSAMSGPPGEDGDKSGDPSIAELIVKLHEKNGGGSVGVMHHDGMGGPVTTHHVGPDGEMSGPNEHATPEEGAGHLAQAMSGGMENEGGEPDGDEYGIA